MRLVSQTTRSPVAGAFALVRKACQQAAKPGRSREGVGERLAPQAESCPLRSRAQGGVEGHEHLVGHAGMDLVDLLVG
jgi:hypothetical protein